MSALTGASSPSAIWQREYQYNVLVAGGMTAEQAEAITNLLQLNSMEAYQGGDGKGGAHWRVQYQRHAFRLNYLIVAVPDYLSSWVWTCSEVECFFGHNK